jgi:hypothetical protein
MTEQNIKVKKYHYNLHCSHWQYSVSSKWFSLATCTGSIYTTLWTVLMWFFYKIMHKMFPFCVMTPCCGVLVCQCFWESSCLSIQRQRKWQHGDLTQIPSVQPEWNAMFKLVHMCPKTKRWEQKPFSGPIFSFFSWKELPRQMDD